MSVISALLITVVYAGVKWAFTEIASGALGTVGDVLMKPRIEKLMASIGGGKHEESVREAVQAAEASLLTEYGADSGAAKVLGALTKTKNKSSEQFWKSASLTYLSLSPMVSSEVDRLSREYAKIVGIPAIIKDEVPPPRQGLKVLNRFFELFREALLRDPELDDLRQYEMLLQDRQRDQILQQILERLTPLPVDLPNLYRSYISFLDNEFRLLDFRGILNFRDVITLPLEEVYVPINVTRETSNLDLRYSSSTGPTVDELPSSLLAEHELAFEEVISHLPRVVVLGHPGSGKSTLVKHLVLHLIHGTAESALDITGDWLPIPFPVSAYADALRRNPDLCLKDYLPMYFSSRSLENMAPLFEYALQNGNCYVCLDGLDEVLDQLERRHVVTRLEDFVREYRDNRFLVTSRITGYECARFAASFSHITLMDLDKEGISRFATQWSGALEKIVTHDSRGATDRAQKRAQDLTRGIFSDANITDLARNPLMLTILALIHYQGKRLPERRADLYRVCVEALAETWNYVRSLSGRPIGLYLRHDRIDERFIVRTLGPIALWLHQNQPGGLIHQADLEAKLTDQFLEDGIGWQQAKDLANDLVALIKEGTGLLQEKGLDHYGFAHFTFEEYLAARYITDISRDPVSHVSQHSDDPEWREIIRLAISSAVPRTATILINKGLLSSNLSSDEHAHNLMLVAECLVDLGKGGVPGSERRKIVREILEEMRNPRRSVIQYRLPIGNLLGQMGDPRFQEPYMEPEMVEIPKGSFDMGSDEADLARVGRRMGRNVRHECPKHLVSLESFHISRYPITNGQYEKFVEDTGHRSPQHWNGPKAPLRIANHPVVNVNWYDAIAYCHWLTEKTGHSYRLPTEAEWEKVCRGSRHQWYPWGDTFARGMANVWESGTEGTCPVGAFSEGRSQYGTEDMVGGVWEWCSTAYAPYPYDDCDGREVMDIDTNRVLRGGAWDSNEFVARCMSRIHRSPCHADEYIGFRVAT